MLRQRVIVAIILVPSAVFIIHRGGVVYLAAILIVLALAAHEYSRIANAAGLRPARWIVIIGVVLLVVAVTEPGRTLLAPGLTLLVMTALAWHAIQFERGAAAPLNDWAATLAGAVYLGWLGGYLVAVRNLLPDGLWWTMTILPGMWLSDTGAYVVGRLFGRHKMVPRLSPKKTWEGFVGGLVAGPLFAGLLAAIWKVGAGPDSPLGWQHGANIGLLVALTGPLGDLGISMMKRQVGVKDTGAVLAGHGGVLDRIDSWLMAGVVGYFYVSWVVLS